MVKTKGEARIEKKPREDSRESGLGVKSCGKEHGGRCEEEPEGEERLGGLLEEMLKRE